ncbi:hypothetical protein [Prosthecobacter sp.]|uniref:hypothetical protein n=1 Tax=Prosthecobacter sp. TaxID=1965333 RepID=UPI003783CE86
MSIICTLTPFPLGSGLAASAFLTAAGGRSGFEAALGGTRAAAREAAQGYWKNLLSNVAGGASGTHQQVNDSLQEAQIQLSSDGNAQDGAQGTPDSGSQIPGNTSSEMRENGKASASAPDVVQDKQQAPEVPTPKAAADLEEAGRVIDDIKRLQTKAGEGPLSAEEQRELHHAEATLALTQVAHLEKEQQELRKLSPPRELDKFKTKALAEAKAVLQRPWPGTDTTNPNGGQLKDPAQQHGLGGGAVHDPTMEEWKDNPNGEKRTISEATEIFRTNFEEFLRLHGKQLGVNLEPALVDQIKFVPDEAIPPENGKKKWAAYRPNSIATGLNGEHKWKDFLGDGKIKVSVDPELLKSDQGIVGIFAHEMLELQGINEAMRENVNGSLPKEGLQQLINDLHTKAIRLQNHLVKFMRDKAANK